MYLHVLADTHSSSLGGIERVSPWLHRVGTATSAQEIVFFWSLLSNGLLEKDFIGFIGLSLDEVVRICQGAVALSCFSRFEYMYVFCCATCTCMYGTLGSSGLLPILVERR